MHLLDQFVGSRRQHAITLSVEPGPQGLLAVFGETELLDVVCAHAVRVVEVIAVPRGDPADRRDGADPMGEQSCAGQRVRSTAGYAPSQELVDAELVQCCCHIARDRGHVAARGSVGPAVPGAVVRDQPDPARNCVIDPEAIEDAGPGRAVVHHDRHTLRVTGLVHQQHPSIGQGDRAGDGRCNESHGRSVAWLALTCVL